MFCPKCGGLLTPKKKDGKAVLICSCGYKKSADDKVSLKEEGKKAKPIEVIEKEEGQKFLLKSTIGDILIVDTDSVENEHITWHMEKSDMDSIGYIVEPKGDLTEVTLWTEFENEKLRKGYEKTADLVLKSLKNYVDFIEEGGDPEDFDKKELMVSP